jgi:hypothetical protein
MARGRPSKGATTLIEFNGSLYLQDLKKAMEVVTAEMREMLYKDIYSNASSLVMKDNTVLMANGDTTSDAERKDALLDSILADKIEWIGGELHTAVRAIANNFKESHIGVYYEYGTGSAALDNMQSLKYYTLGDRNPYRTGKEIVSRSKYGRMIKEEVNGKGVTVGLEGYWRDMAGNLRRTRSTWGGVRNEGFIRAIGGDTQPQLWYYRGVLNLKQKYRSMILEAIKKVNPFDKRYFYLNPSYNLVMK